MATKPCNIEGYQIDFTPPVSGSGKRAPYDSPGTQAWEETMYNYYKTCYSRDGVDRRVPDAVCQPRYPLPDEYSLAYLAVRKFYPDARPLADILHADLAGADAGNFARFRRRKRQLAAGVRIAEACIGWNNLHD